MRRINSLDSLRGLAALLVVFTHLASSLPGARAAVNAVWLLRPLVAGPAWVRVFFVLSGFVLFLAVDRRDGFRYGPFLARRVARIVPPLAVAVLGSALLYRLCDPHPLAGTSDWLRLTSWTAPPTPRVIARHLLLLDGGPSQQLDNVIWSLVHEVRLSLVFPLIALAVRARPWATAGAALILSALSVHAAWAMPVDLPVNLFTTLSYGFCFAAGAALAARGEAVRALFAGAGASLPLACLSAGWALLALDTNMASGLPAQLGAVLVVALCFADPRAVRVLGRAPLIWLGRVSYSLYLVHVPVLLALTYAGGGALPRWLAAALTLPVSLVLAELGHRFVEQPSIEAGRWLAQQLERPVAAAA